MSTQKFEVETMVDGEVYKGNASIQGDMLTVSAGKYGEKSASLSADNTFLAQLLLTELINEFSGHGW